MKRPMRLRSFLALVVLSGLVLPLRGQAATETSGIALPGQQAAEAVTGEDAKPSPDGNGWTRSMDKVLERAIEMDLYGVTAQLPKGVASMKWDWGMISAKRRYDAYRRPGPLLAPFELNGETVELGMGGHGGGHTFQWSYGIIDELDWYFELPFTYMNVSFKPNQGGKKVLCQLFPQIGRETPDYSYEGAWLLGDINTGFSWNIYRNPWFSVALTPRVFLPTGHQPDPNRSLTWGMGPELEVGIGGWAVGFTQGYDVRPFARGVLPWWMDIVLSSEFGFSYAFPQKRRYPNNFKPQELDPAAIDPEVARLFPDLSHLNPANDNFNGKTHFTYTPGMGLSWTAQVELGLALFGVGFAYGIEHGAEAEFGGDTDYAFQQMANALELTGTQTTHAIQLACSVNLIPFYVPVQVSYQWRKVVDGFNAIIFDDFHQITVKAYFPVLID